MTLNGEFESYITTTPTFCSRILADDNKELEKRLMKQLKDTGMIDVRVYYTYDTFEDDARFDIYIITKRKADGIRIEDEDTPSDELIEDEIHVWAWDRLIEEMHEAIVEGEVSKLPPVHWDMFI